MLVFFINLSFMEFLVGYLEVVLYGKSSQEYSVTASAAQGFILAPTLFLLKINELPHDVICNIAIYADDNTLYSNSKCDQISDLWQLESTSELESDQWDTVDWGRKWLVDFNSGKTQLASFNWPNNSGDIDVKMYVSIIEKKKNI